MKYLKALPTGGLYRIAACALCSLLISCSVVGPDSIRTGRLAYNEAITETNNQQMLMVLVHNRYEESNQLLVVSSVTANVRVSSSAQVEAGFGDSDNYEGSLVPFRGGFLYEENPTISYTPVTGETYLRQLMSPMPLSLVAQVTQSLPYPESVYTMLLASVNGIHNPAFLFGSHQDDPRFDRLVAIMTELTHHNSLHWVRDPGKAAGLSLTLATTTDQDIALVNELLELLRIPEPSKHSDRLVIPASLALYHENSGGIGITTRSVWELVEILSSAVQVPEEDETSGIAADFPRPGRAGRDLEIRYASSKPEQAYVAVEHRGGWFYIDAGDQVTKRYFKRMGNLWSAAMAQAMGPTSTPVLTVPVSR